MLQINYIIVLYNDTYSKAYFQNTRRTNDNRL